MRCGEMTAVVDAKQTPQGCVRQCAAGRPAALLGDEMTTNQATTIEAELRADIATAQVMRFEQREVQDHVRREEGVLWLDLCLTQRLQGARACFPERWGAQRFKEIGELFFVPPGEVLLTRSGIGSLKTLMCRIDAELMSKWLDTDLQWTERRLAAGLDVRDPSIRCHLMRLTQEVSHPGFASATLLELIAAQVAIELGRYFAAMKGQRSLKGLATWRLRLVDERVRELGKAPTLTELAKLCGLSVRQLSRGFRASRRFTLTLPSHGH